MIDVLKQLLVPGGLVSVFLVWWTTSHTKKSDEKTEVSAKMQAESQQVVSASGVEERWQSLFDQLVATNAQDLAGVKEELRETKLDIQSLKRREGVHYDYHFALRGQVKDLGATPYQWPKEIDPSAN